MGQDGPVSAAGPTLIHSSVKLKLTQLNSESGCSQLQPVSQKTRLCNQITAACTETVAIFQLCNIWVKVGVPDEELEASQPTFLDRIIIICSETLELVQKHKAASFWPDTHNWHITSCHQHHIIYLASWLSHATSHKNEIKRKVYSELLIGIQLLTKTSIGLK